MISYRPYNVVFPLFRAEDLTEEGITEFLSGFQDFEIQKDDYLVGISVSNATEVREVFERLIAVGFFYDEIKSGSEDFTVVAKEGLWWPVPWLVNNAGNIWFIADIQAPV